MAVPLFLFGIRLLSAALLLILVGTMGYLVLQEIGDWGRASAEAPDGSRGLLRVIADGGGEPVEGSEFPVLVVTTIGRNRHNNIVVTDSFASGEHARITRRGRQLWLEDSGSRNGTQLNHMRLDEAAVLASGDVIAIGKIQFQVDIPV